MKIKIFESNKEIDLDKLVDTRALICANSGGGKSYCVRKILEESKNVMSIILDTEGEFNTLREQFDFLLIGENGDVDLSPKAVNLLPQKLLELNLPPIIDLSELQQKERINYVKEFLESLMELKKEFWKPCLIFIDEIHRYAGQQEKQDSTYSVIDVATRGRKRGYALIGCTQRISKLHKDVVAELNNYLIGRTSLDIDMKRSSEILGFSAKEDMLKLRDLEDGEFFVFGPAISKTIEKEQVSESKTTHPKRGMDVRSKISKPNDEIRKVLKKINELPKKQEKELKELSDYKIEVARLKKEISKKPDIIKDNKSLEQSKMEGYNIAEKQYSKNIKELKEKIKQNQFLVLKMKNLLTKNLKEYSNILNIETPQIEIRKPISFIHKIPPKRELLEVNQDSPSSMDLNKCAKTIYTLLLENSGRGFSRTQISLLTGYSHKSGGFANAMAQLNTSNLIRKDGNLISIGDINSDIATERMEFNKENLLKKLGKCPREIIDVLIENSEEEFSREELANLTPSNYSPNSGGFANSLAKLNSLDLIKKNGTKIKINPEVLEI